MTCYSPIKAVRTLGGLSIKPNTYFGTDAFKVPCGKCVGCMQDRSRSWAVRCVHESSLHLDNCFISLTYDDEHVPFDGALDLPAFQRFLKRLRKHFFPQRFRYFAAGEYGGERGRPHYHAILFGLDFPDKVFFKMSGKHRLFISSTLSSIWTAGFASVGSVTIESAAYVAQYCLKKAGRYVIDGHYTILESETGELRKLPRQFCVMSRRPGIGSGWIDKYLSDVYPDDFVVVAGKRNRVPRYYDKKLDAVSSSKLIDVKSVRVKRAREHYLDSSAKRLLVREAVESSRLKLKSRKL